MFNIGFGELILVLLVAFVFVGPKDLPKVARALGRGVRTIKQYLRDFQDETGIGDVVDEFKKTSSDLEKTFKEADPTEDLKQAKQDLEQAVQASADAVKETFEK